MSGEQRIQFTLNGRTVRVSVDRDETLVTTLRELGEYTVRESCGVGLCGSCAVRVDGRSVSGCLYWSVLADGCEVVTLSGLSDDPRAVALQDAIGRCGGAQCGYCTPGMVVTALDLVGTGEKHGHDEVCEWMSGNLCRCACYPQLTEAITSAANDTIVETQGGVR
ncbi:(2Fe-2S)-binding protein (plasmid) [Mycolicibacterium psychrotolerans]|uniref:(2Fe-2S)-binding protein n=1 Tax=Mycolicibacterium psychrotolerans TaxID=216929 RepID=UPI003D67055B